MQREQTLSETFKPITESLNRLANVVITKIRSKEEPEKVEQQHDEDRAIIDYIAEHGGVTQMDTIYGISKGPPFKLGKFPIRLTENTIQVGETKYESTPGLLELIFLKTSKPEKYRAKDLQTYAEILRQTNVHRKNFTKKGHIKAESSEKYRNIIKPALAGKFEYGTGIDIQNKKLNDLPLQYIYFDDPNEIIERLRLITASAAAGNTAHTNEIISIISELRERRIIE